MTAPASAGADHDEGEFAARPEQQRHFRPPRATDRRKPRAATKTIAALATMSPAARPSTSGGARDEIGKVELGADGDEEQPEQQAL